MVRFALLLLSLCCHPQVVHGFLPAWMPGALTSAPELERHIKQEANTPLDVRLSIGLKSDQVFVIDGLQFNLCSSKPPHDSTVPLPGANGPRPWLSNGVHEIETLKGLIKNLLNNKCLILIEISDEKFSEVNKYLVKNSFKQIFKSNSFGAELNKTSYYKDDLAQILSVAKTDSDKLVAIFHFVKSKVKWNNLSPM